MTNINNLNVFTFIKDIYQSLKHIDQQFSNFNETINKRLTKIEDNHQIMVDKLTNIEYLLSKLGENHSVNTNLDKKIENELLDKMRIMNNLNIHNDDSKIELKLDELTFANILENDYTFSDINDSITKSNEHNLYNTLDNNMSNNMSNNMDNNLNNYSNKKIFFNSNSGSSNSNSNREESLNNLLF
jgi:hypothetical protein